MLPRISGLEPDLAQLTNVGDQRVPFVAVAPIQAEAIRGCTFLNSVATQTKSSLAAESSAGEKPVNLP